MRDGTLFVKKSYICTIFLTETGAILDEEAYEKANLSNLSDFLGLKKYEPFVFVNDIDVEGLGNSFLPDVFEDIFILSYLDRESNIRSFLPELLENCFQAKFYKIEPFSLEPSGLAMNEVIYTFGDIALSRLVYKLTDSILVDVYEGSCS